MGSPRPDWAELPSNVRSAVERIIDDRVLAATTQSGGFSPGVAAILELASGQRAFVKVADESFNPGGAALHRREARFMRACPEVPGARLWGIHDDDGWVALVLDVIEGRLPTLPWELEELEATLDALHRLRATPGPPGLPRFVDEHAPLFDGWRSLATGDRDSSGLDDWAQRNLLALADMEESWTAAYDGACVVHGDVRADNVLLGERGAVLVDWAQAALGAAWADLVLFLPSAELAGAPPAAELWAAHGPPVERDVLAIAVGAFVGYLTSRSFDPTPPGLPTLRRFQADQAAVAQRWLRQLVAWR